MAGARLALPYGDADRGSGPLDGGIGLRRRVVNATVDKAYDRRDPAAHLTELKAPALWHRARGDRHRHRCGMDGPGPDRTLRGLPEDGAIG